MPPIGFVVRRPILARPSSYGITSFVHFPLDSAMMKSKEKHPTERLAIPTQPPPFAPWPNGIRSLMSRRQLTFGRIMSPALRATTWSWMNLRVCCLPFGEPGTSRATRLRTCTAII